MVRVEALRVESGPFDQAITGQNNEPKKVEPNANSEEVEYESCTAVGR